jgi:hypothetical protein
LRISPFFPYQREKKQKEKNGALNSINNAPSKKKKGVFFPSSKKTKRGSFKLPSQHIIKNKTKNGEIQALPIENDTKNGVQNCLGNK